MNEVDWIKHQILNALYVRYWSVHWRVIEAGKVLISYLGSAVEGAADVSDGGHFVMMMEDDVDESKINFGSVNALFDQRGWSNGSFRKSGRGEKQSHMHVICLWEVRGCSKKREQLFLHHEHGPINTHQGNITRSLITNRTTISYKTKSGS